MQLSFGAPEKASMTASDELLTVGELAARLKIKPSWVYSHADDLGAFRLGKYLRFSMPRVMERLERGRASGSRVGAPTQLPKLSPTNDSTSDEQGTTREQKN
jgi:hypothetical protein